MSSQETKISRQAMRHKLTELAFQDISTKYKVPRRARRAMSRAIGKKAFQAWRGGDVQSTKN